jgi:hypothetical protein
MLIIFEVTANATSTFKFLQYPRYAQGRVIYRLPKTRIMPFAWFVYTPGCENKDAIPRQHSA